MEKNLGHATAYGYAKSKGYSGTEEEFAQLMADYASVGQSAAQSAEQAAASATSASGSAAMASQAAQTATDKASEAVTAAGTATTKASEASESASTASNAATSASTSAQTATTAAATATTKASEASESAATATTAKTDAETARDAAAQSASEAAESARTLTIDATLTQSGQAADAKTTGDAIDKANYGLIALKIISGKYVNPTTGAYISSTNAKATDYVPCNPNEDILLNAASASSYGAWYDSGKNRVASLSIDAGLNYITAPSNAYFFATSTLDASVENLQIYSKIGIDLKMLNGSVDSVKDFRNTKAYSVGTKDVVTDNLYDPSASTEGYYLSGSSGTPTANSAYGYSDYISISGDKYLYSDNIKSTAIYFYDENKSLVSPGAKVVRDYALASTWPSRAKYCRFNFSISAIDSITFRTSLNTGYYISKAQILDNVYDIHVGSTREYTTLKSAVDYINYIADEDAEYNILLDEDTYDALDGFTLSSQSSTFMGIVLPDHTNIIGQGNPANTIISVDGTDFPENITNNEVSVLNMYRNHKISNVTIMSKNIRYGVHADDSYRATNPVSDAVMEFDNVHFVNLAKTVTGIASYCIGIGAKKGQHFIFKNCWIENQDTTYCAFLAHNGTTAEKPVRYDFDACKISNNGPYGMRFTTTAYNLLDIVNICGCKSNKNIILDKAGSNTDTNTGYKFYGHGNSGIEFSVNGIVLNDYDTEMML